MRGTTQKRGELRSIWEASGGIWEASGGIWRHLEASGGIWEASGGIWRHLGGIWRHLGSIWRHLEASVDFSKKRLIFHNISSIIAWSG